MINEEMKMHAAHILYELDDFAVNEQLDVIGLAYLTVAANYATAGMSEGKERQLVILTAIGKHLEGIRESIHTSCATSIFGGPKDKEDCHER